MDRFLSLPEDKQNFIIDAAFATFAANGYKKASVNDIAVAAGISKAMVFHYFGTKKALYLYLMELCGRTFMNEISRKLNRDVTDFFDRIMQATDIKIAIMKEHPAMLSFINSAYYETDAEVRTDLQAIFTSEQGENFRTEVIFDGMDASKFKDGVDPQLVMKMLTGFAYGYMNLTPGQEMDVDAIYEDFQNCVQLLKSNLYKEE